ncbi:septum formation protein Maf [Allofranklinella schreckenbergeri]|uniref:dTTP/UTP pyrophosphatase n=1 Tax=Allofranklinella schreckenbergeri TaxID=1076744 RepID=A0A3M6R6X7_9BURK|nr:Maf family protein [Allofranklinella schreckenbergeri]RMX11106.1 septum formation protein Maf [Allofranklinella schreckenbergeri]
MRDDDRKIYLASQSPRRSQLLTQIGVPHALLLPDAADPHSDDRPDALEALEAVLPGEAPREYVQRVTRLKLQAAQARAQRRGLPPAPILCADTTVALGTQILGKPADAQDARQMLSALSGCSHEVLTAVAVAWPPAWHTGQGRPGQGGAVVQALSVSRVQFAALDAPTLERYIASGEWQGKAGGYGIQGLAAVMVAHIEGSYSGIMGLPLYETHQLLRPWLERQSLETP